MRGDTYAHRRLAGLVDGGVEKVVGGVEAAAFWAAVGFPVIYAGAFLATVVLPDAAVVQKQVLGALLTANVLALVVGHRYQRGG